MDRTACALVPVQIPSYLSQFASSKFPLSSLCSMARRMEGSLCFACMDAPFLPSSTRKSSHAANVLMPSEGDWKRAPSLACSGPLSQKGHPILDRRIFLHALYPANFSNPTLHSLTLYNVDLFVHHTWTRTFITNGKTGKEGKYAHNPIPCLLSN